MDQEPSTTGPDLDDASRTPEEIRADIAQTREEVGDTVEALAAKTDVKAQAHERVDQLKESVRSNPAPLILGGVAVGALLLVRRSRRRAL